MHPRHVWAPERKTTSTTGLGEKAHFLNPNPLGIQAINTNLIHNYSFREKRIKRKVSARSFKGVVSPHP